jgi:hypothetical protein
MRHSRFFPTVILAAAIVPGAACAQSSTATRGTDVITPALVSKHLRVIADDSMQGRDTPSRGLELTAQYIADNFKRVGLKPGASDGSYLQRYRIMKQRVDGTGSWVRLMVGDVTASASLARDARYVSGTRAGKQVTGQTLVMGGALDSASIARAAIDGRVVLFMIDYSKPSMAEQNSWWKLILERRPAALILVSNREPRLFDQVVRRQFMEMTTIEYSTEIEPLVIEAHERAIGAALSRANIDPARVRGSTEPVAQAVSDLRVSMSVSDLPGGETTAPNTVGILEGSDPALRNEYIVISAHMDHVGVDRSSTADSIWNGADDDASGTTGVIVLAEAFAKARPKRSMIFLTVSGEEKGLWGSEVFAANPPVPIGQIVADLNLDMIGRNWKDTIVVIGKEHSDLGATLERVNVAHPELKMTAIDDIWPQENFYGRSDHYNFAKRGVPILFFFNGTHPDYHQPSDSPDKIDFEKESRILRLVYYLGQEVGNAPARPKWKPESYRKIVGSR